MFEDKKPEIDDFYWNSNEIRIEIETDDMIFIKVFSKNEEGTIQSKIEVIPKREYLERIREEITCDDFDSLPDNEKKA